MIDILLKLGAFQSILLAVLLFRKKTNNKANLVLAALVFLFGISCLFYSFNNIETFLQLPHLIRLDWGLPLLFGPLIYIYTLSLVYKKKRAESCYPHFIPYLINLVILAPFFIKSSEEKIQILDYFTASITSGTDYYSYYGFVLRLAISGISLYYAFKSLRIINVYKNNSLHEYSNTDKIKLKWLQFVMYSFMLLSILFIVVSIFTFGDRYPQFDYNVYYFLFIFILIYILSYKTLSQPELINFNFDFKTSSETKVVKEIFETTEQARNLQVYMIDEKPYLSGELTATALAKSLNLSRHQLSNILNKQLGKNFYDYINELRAEEFKRRITLKENQNLTLLAIAFDSGFNSKTTFNTIFKKITGLTPSQYKKSIK